MPIDQHMRYTDSQTIKAHTKDIPSYQLPWSPAEGMPQSRPQASVHSQQSSAIARPDFPVSYRFLSVCPLMPGTSSQHWHRWAPCHPHPLRPVQDETCPPQPEGSHGLFVEEIDRIQQRSRVTNSWSHQGVKRCKECPSDREIWVMSINNSQNGWIMCNEHRFHFCSFVHVTMTIIKLHMIDICHWKPFALQYINESKSVRFSFQYSVNKQHF